MRTFLFLSLLLDVPYSAISWLDFLLLTSNMCSKYQNQSINQSMDFLGVINTIFDQENVIFRIL